MKLKIALVGFLWHRVPPPKYGGIEMGDYLLAEGLIAKGHHVTLFAAGTSKTKAKLISVYPKPLYRAGISWSNITYPYLNFLGAFLKSNEFDIIHLPLCLYQDYLALPLSRLINTKVIFTTRSELPSRKSGEDSLNKEKRLLLSQFPDNNFVSISYSQRRGWKRLNWVRNIYNGINVSDYPFNPREGKYLVWVGKIGRNKGTHEAIKLAKRLSEKLILAGPVDKNDPVRIKYWKEKIKPHVDGREIIYVGEVTRKKVAKLFGEAKVFINPIKWEEAFGFVMAESMCCGTPVIVYNRGSASELVVNNKTGFVVSNFEQMVEAVKKIDQIKREDCHKWAVKIFSADRMVEECEELYEKLLRG